MLGGAVGLLEKNYGVNTGSYRGRGSRSGPPPPRRGFYGGPPSSRGGPPPSGISPNYKGTRPIPQFVRGASSRGRISRNVANGAGSKPQIKKAIKNTVAAANGKQPRPAKAFRHDPNDIVSGIVIEGYPEEKITDEQFALIQNELQDKLRGALIGDTAPQFRKCFMKSGMAVVISVNDNTKNWLDELVPSLKPWEGAVLKVVVPGSEAKHKVLFTMRNPLKDAEPKDILARLKEQNKGLRTENWILFHKVTNKKGWVSYFYNIDGESYASITKNDNIAFLGLEQIIFKQYVKRQGVEIDSDDEFVEPKKEEEKTEEKVVEEVKEEVKKEEAK